MIKPVAMQQNLLTLPDLPYPTQSLKVIHRIRNIITPGLTFQHIIKDFLEVFLFLSPLRLIQLSVFLSI